MTITIGLSNIPLAEELVFAGSMAIVITLITNWSRNYPAPRHAL